MRKDFIKLQSKDQHRHSLVIYSAILAVTALAAGFSDQIMSNYFKDAYNVTAFQRGLIEFPRELPGILVMFIVSGLFFLGNTRIAMVAQALALCGMIALGFLTPSFAVMLVFLFINSLGIHVWFPMQDSIGMNLIHDEQNAGRIVGRFKGISTAFSMLASIVVFLGFRFGLFSFTTPIKVVFLLAAVFLFIAFILLSVLHRINHPADKPSGPARKFHFVFHKEYRYYYILATVFGVQKQMMFVYGPWVLIELLDKKADTLALLVMIGSFIGIFFIPALGRWLDRFGIKRMLYADAFSFIAVYIAYGLLSAGFSSGILPKSGIPVILTFTLFIVDRMSMQMGIIRALYLRSIAITPDDIGPTLTLGQGMDHVVSILCATLGGLVWSTWGPQYIFFLAAGLSMVNYLVAVKVKIPAPAMVK